MLTKAMAIDHGLKHTRKLHLSAIDRGNVIGEGTFRPQLQGQRLCGRGRLRHDPAWALRGQPVDVAEWGGSGFREESSWLTRGGDSVGCGGLTAY